MIIGRNSIVKLGNVFRETVNKKTGTVVQKAIVNETRGLCGDIKLNGVKKLITYGKQTPLRKKGIDQVMITTYKDGCKEYEYFHKGKPLFEMGYDKVSMHYSHPVLPPEYPAFPAKQYLTESVRKLINP